MKPSDSADSFLRRRRRWVESSEPTFREIGAFRGFHPPYKLGQLMPESPNVEIAHKLIEHDPKHSRRMELTEIAEAIVLALVAVATAWCGFQADRWGGRQAYFYGVSTQLRVEAAVSATEGGQQHLHDTMTFNSWLQANQGNDQKLMATYEHRFSAEYRVAFKAWLKTEPFTNPNSPASPAFHPEYHNGLLKKSKQLAEEANASFGEGTESSEVSEKYVRATLLFATVLFLIALSQRFKLPRVRAGLLIIASVLMCYTFIIVASYPRL